MRQRERQCSASWGEGGGKGRVWVVLGSCLGCRNGARGRELGVFLRRQSEVVGEVDDEGVQGNLQRPHGGLDGTGGGGGK